MQTNLTKTGLRYKISFGADFPRHNDEGAEYPDDASAIAGAHESLWHIAYDQMTEEEVQRKISVTLTNAAGHCIYAASITDNGVCP